MAKMRELGENPKKFFNYEILTTYDEKCFAVSTNSTIDDDELDGVVGWPESDKEDTQVGRLTYSAGENDHSQILDSKLEKLLGIDSNNYNDAKKNIADTGSSSSNICELGRLNNIRVSPKYRGKGIAKNLVKYMKQKLNNHLIFLHVDSDTKDAALSLYKSAGFKPFNDNADYMVYIPKNSKVYETLKSKLKA